MPRRTTLAVLIVVSLLAAVGLVMWKPHNVASGLVEPVSVDRLTGSVEAESAPLADERTARSVAAEAVAVPTPSALVAPTPSVVTPQQPDLQAKTPFEIVVVDSNGQPVFDAVIRITGMRSASDPGSWYEFRGGDVVARTDPKGRAKLDVWDWVDIHGRTISVDVSVTHAEFVPLRDDSFEIGPVERTIVLRRGAVVSVRAWHGSPDQVVEGISIELEREAALGANAWTRESDGRMVATRIAAERHVLGVKSGRTQPGGRSLHSEPESFEVRPNERLDLSVELHAALTWTGKLADSVPRPVVDGRVQLTFVDHFEGPDASGCLSNSFETEVLPDGSFTIADLPPGRGYVFAACRGYVSSEVRAPTLAEAGIRLPDGATGEDEAEAWKTFANLKTQLQRIELVPLQRPTTIEMCATGVVEVTVTKPDGAPIPHADVYASPNVSVPHHGSTLGRGATGRRKPMRAASRASRKCRRIRTSGSAQQQPDSR